MNKEEVSMVKKQFGETVQEIRLSKRLTLRQLSYQCDLDNSKLTKIEKGKINVSLATLIEVARGLGVHPSELLKNG